MNHKRRHRKSRRAGCILCKPHKHQSLKDSESSQTMQEKRSRVSEKEQKEEIP